MDSRVVNTFLGVHQKKTPERVFFCVVDGRDSRVVNTF